MQRATTLAAIIAIALPAYAQQDRQLDAHEHGVGLLNIAFEGDQVAMELEAPGADIVGFEHPPESDEDRAAISGAIAVLATPLELFSIPDAAGCTVVEANAALVGENADHEEHGHGHGHDHAEEGEHKEHADEGEHKEHAGEEHHEDEEGHTEFRAEYLLACTAPDTIDRIAFPYFSQFPNARELEVQMISDKGTQGFEIERDSPVLSLEGLI
ncbi:MAG: DUF2796 domain-containing protein [Paracoccaceae bacterium]|nr:DUF2796 domain-containing protein [Paracoccaceae bacterium]